MMPRSANYRPLVRTTIAHPLRAEGNGSAGTRRHPSLSRACAIEMLEHRRLLSAAVATETAQPANLHAIQVASDPETAPASAAAASALTINNESQTYATLADTTVTMTGRSELHITASANPVSGSIINLN